MSSDSTLDPAQAQVLGAYEQTQRELVDAQNVCERMLALIGESYDDMHTLAWNLSRLKKHDDMRKEEATF